MGGKGLIALAGLLAAVPAASADMPNDALKEAIRKEVKNELRDPESARFSWLPMQSTEAYCGYVNARNGFGGYAGKALFMVLLFDGRDGPVPSPAFLADPNPESSRHRALAEQCLKAGISLAAPTTDDPAS